MNCLVLSRLVTCDTSTYNIFVLRIYITVDLLILFQHILDLVFYIAF